MVVVSAHCCAGYAAGWGAGSGGPGLGGRCEGEGACHVEDLFAALLAIRVPSELKARPLRARTRECRSRLVRRTMPGWQMHVLGEVVQGLVGAGQPVVEEAESDADAGGDGGGGVTGRVGLYFGQDRRGQGGVAVSEGLDD